MRRADDLNRHPCSPSLGARLANLRQEHWRHPNVRRGSPFQDRASWCGDFSASRIQDGNPFRACHEVGSGVLRFRPTLCWREMDSDFRFLVPAMRPSNRHGRRDCCLGKGERIWCGTKGSNPSPSSGESGTNRTPSLRGRRSIHQLDRYRRDIRRLGRQRRYGFDCSPWYDHARDRKQKPGRTGTCDAA